MKKLRKRKNFFSSLNFHLRMDAFCQETDYTTWCCGKNRENFHDIAKQRKGKITECRIKVNKKSFVLVGFGFSVRRHQRKSSIECKYLCEN